MMRHNSSRLQLSSSTENHFRIRPAAPEDAEALLKIYTPYVRETAITFEYETPTTDEFARRIRHTLERFPYLAAEQDGCLVGYAYVGVFHDRPAYDWAVETSIYVDQSQRRTGIGSCLYAALETVLCRQGILNLNACIACPHGDIPGSAGSGQKNIPDFFLSDQSEPETSCLSDRHEPDDPYLTWDSVRFHEEMGYHMAGRFHQCGYKFHRWYDMVWMEKSIGEHLENQPPIRPFPEIAEELFSPSPLSCDPNRFILPVR